MSGWDSFFVLLMEVLLSFFKKKKDNCFCGISIELTVHGIYLTNEKLLSPDGAGRLMPLHIGYGC